MSLAPKLAMHIGSMVALYFCQGLVQGTLIILPTVAMHQAPELQPADLAFLGIPMYAFTLKFLWSPVVDAMALPHGVSGALLPKWCHRRLQWIGLLQLAMGAVYLWMLSTPDFVQRVAVDRDLTPVAALFALAVMSSSQDVAVDAWTVEGLPPSRTSLAGTLQLIGLLLGILGSNQYASWWTAGSVDLPISWYFGVCFCCNMCGVLVAVANAIINPLSKAADESPESVRAAFTELLQFVKTPRCRCFVGYLLTASITGATHQLTGMQLVKMGLDVSDMSSLTSIAIVTELIASPLISRWIMGRPIVPTLLRLTLIEYFTLPLTAALLYYTFTPSSWYVYGILLPITLIQTAVDGSVFVAKSTLMSKEAGRHLHITGSTVTVLNSVSNAGVKVPNTLALMLANHLQGTLATQSEEVDRRPLRLVCLMAAFVLAFAALLRRYVMVPCALKLQGNSVSAS